MNPRTVLPYYIGVIAILFLIISPQMFSHGMFIDGLLYARISMNLAEGIGSFWHLQYSSFFSDVLEGQPPLAFGIQSLFFRVFGDSFLVERFYSLLTFIITGFIIYRIWRFMKGSDAFATGWMPILMWGLIPLVFWAVSNNVLENTMMIFVSLSVLFILKSTQGHRILYLVLSGLCISGAFLTKGFTGIFPISFIFWLWLFRRTNSFRSCLIDTTLLTIVALIPYVLIYFFYEEAFLSLQAYLNVQVIHSLSSVQTVSTRFYILGRLLSELVPVFLICFLVYMTMRQYKIKHERTGWGLSFLALGLSGVIPMMVSLKQSGFYMLTAFPFFCLALAYFIAPELIQMMKTLELKKKAYRYLKYTSFSLFFISIGSLIYFTGKIGREHEMLEDVFTLSEHLERGTLVSIDPSLATEWSLRDYLGRYSDIILHQRTPYSDCFLVGKQSDFTVPGGYEKDTIQLHLYDLYIRAELQ